MKLRKMLTKKKSCKLNEFKDYLISTGFTKVSTQMLSYIDVFDNEKEWSALDITT